MVNERYLSGMGAKPEGDGVLQAHFTASDRRMRSRHPAHEHAVHGSSPQRSGKKLMKSAALLIGLVLLALGVACFVPGLATDGTLFGMFPVTTPLALAFIVTGAVGVMIGLTRNRELAPPRSSNDLRDLH